MTEPKKARAGCPALFLFPSYYVATVLGTGESMAESCMFKASPAQTPVLWRSLGASCQQVLPKAKQYHGHLPAL